MPPPRLCPPKGSLPPSSPSFRYESGAMAAAGEADAYRKQVVRALVRRGQARAALGLVHDAETDYVEALR